VSTPPETSKKETDIVAPAQDVMVADVISGAPGADYITCNLLRGSFVKLLEQESCVTVQ
jgi:hypothetical protein